MDNKQTTNVHELHHHDNDVDVDTYDTGIVPAETAARKEREGEHYKETPAKGYTVDKEGILNNYAIEPEMYVDVPGDLRAEEEARHAQKAAELQELNLDDEEGKLTSDGDRRGKGQGLI